MIKWKNNLLSSQKVYRSADMKSKLTKISESAPSTSAQALSLYESDSSKTVFYVNICKQYRQLIYLFSKFSNFLYLFLGNERCEVLFKVSIQNR